MDQPSIDLRPRRRRRSSEPYFRIISELPDKLPLTEAEVRLFVALLGGRDGARRILEGGEITQADVDDTSALGYRSKKPTH